MLHYFLTRAISLVASVYDDDETPTLNFLKNFFPPLSKCPSFKRKAKTEKELEDTETCSSSTNKHSKERGEWLERASKWKYKQRLRLKSDAASYSLKRNRITATYVPTSDDNNNSFYFQNNRFHSPKKLPSFGLGTAKLAHSTSLFSATYFPYFFPSCLSFQV